MFGHPSIFTCRIVRLSFCVVCWSTRSRHSENEQQNYLGHMLVLCVGGGNWLRVRAKCKHGTCLGATFQSLTRLNMVRVSKRSFSVPRCVMCVVGWHHWSWIRSHARFSITDVSYNGRRWTNFKFRHENMAAQDSWTWSSTWSARGLCWLATSQRLASEGRGLAQWSSMSESVCVCVFFFFFFSFSFFFFFLFLPF